MRKTWFLIAAVTTGLLTGTARAHELWFKLDPGDPASVRLYFADAPQPGEAERVADIARTKVWVDGRPLEVKRLPDGLEARLPEQRPAVVTAFADRGVVTYQGDSFIIYLAAYAQTQPVEPSKVTSVGIPDEQLRLNLLIPDEGKPVVKATWKGKPVADAVVKVFRGTGEPTELRTDGRGEIPWAAFGKSPVSLLAQVVDKTPGRRDGKDYSEVRYKATLTIDLEAGGRLAGSSLAECLSRVKEIHGDAGPWAVAGYRMGERALHDLGLPRHSFTLMVVHSAPAEVRYSCVADGLQAATGASAGKLNLRVELASAEAMSTVIRDQRTGRTLTFTLRPAFVRSILNLSRDRVPAEGRRVAEMPESEIFTVTESK